MQHCMRSTYCGSSLTLSSPQILGLPSLLPRSSLTLSSPQYLLWIFSNPLFSPGDQIVKVNEVELEGRTLAEALTILKDQPSDIYLTILPSELATAKLGAYSTTLTI